VGDGGSSVSKCDTTGYGDGSMSSLMTCILSVGLNVSISQPDAFGASIAALIPAPRSSSVPAGIEAV